MKTQLSFKLYKNVKGAVVGDLYHDGHAILATTHPATIAAAIFAMNEKMFIFESSLGKGKFKFPLVDNELQKIASLLKDQDEANHMSAFATFSHFDFKQPHPFDTQADIHLRVAIHHLAPELVKVVPLVPVRKGFKKELRNRNKYVYWPIC